MTTGNELIQEEDNDELLELQFSEIDNQIIKLQPEKDQLLRQLDEFRRTRESSNTGCCAACKYQRKQCSPECIFAEMFPQEYYKHFVIFHHLFGMDRILEMLTPGAGVSHQISRLTRDELYRFTKEFQRHSRVKNDRDLHIRQVCWERIELLKKIDNDLQKVMDDYLQ